MDSSSSPRESQQQQQQQQQQQPQPPQPPPQQYATRSQIRRGIEHIIRRLLLQRIVSLHNHHHNHNHNHNHQHQHIMNIQLSKADRHRALRQSRLLEDILYKRADTMSDYGDAATLEERVYKAGRAVFITAQRQEMERESERRVAAGGGVETRGSGVGVGVGRVGAGAGGGALVFGGQQRQRAAALRVGRPARRMSF